MQSKTNAGPVAQLDLEYLTTDQKVAGLNPAGVTTKREMPSFLLCTTFTLFKVKITEKGIQGLQKTSIIELMNITTEIQNQ